MRSGVMRVTRLLKQRMKSNLVDELFYEQIDTYYGAFHSYKIETAAGKDGRQLCCGLVANFWSYLCAKNYFKNI